MSVVFENIKTADYPAFLKLYNGNFPDNERRLYKDTDDLAEFIKKKGGKFHAFTAKDGTEVIAFLSYWNFEGYTYIEHFTVAEPQRGRRIGTEMLHHLFKTVSENVLLEVEKPETEEAKRRIEFYERNQFRVRKELDYTQPPYSKEQGPVEMLLMTHGDVDLKDKSSIREMLREVYNVEKYEPKKDLQ